MDPNNASFAYFNLEKWSATMADAHNGRRWEYRRLNHKRTLGAWSRENLNVDRQWFPTSLGTWVRQREQSGRVD